MITPSSDKQVPRHRAKECSDERSSWRDMPLRAKVSLMLVLATVLGGFVGLLDAFLGHPPYVLPGGLLFVVLVMLQIGKYVIWHPLEALAAQLLRIEKTHEIKRDEKLPTNRRDEVGQIARTVKHLIGMNIRDNSEVRQLRRTMDNRVETAIKKATHRLERLANRDPLTGLGNRRYLEESLDELVDSAKATRTDLVCMTMDMDNFKQVNDTLGHAVGDELLTFTASLIKSTTRTDDHPIRLGGDEFVILMPGCDETHAKQLANQLRGLFAQHVNTAYAGAGGVSLSTGIASLREYDIHDGKDLLEVADRRLYVAKRSGKGRAVASR